MPAEIVFRFRQQRSDKSGPSDGKTVQNQLDEFTLRTLIDAIETYQGFEQWEARDDRRYFEGLTLEQAISIAGRGKIRHDRIHPHLKPNGRRPLTARREAALETFCRLLMEQDTIDRIGTATSFHEIYEIMWEIGRLVDDIGPVTVYDAAVSIGANRGYEPDEIYLHAAPLEAAKALIRGLGNRICIRVEELPEEVCDVLRRHNKTGTAFTPGEIEDILCLFQVLRLRRM